MEYMASHDRPCVTTATSDLTEAHPTSVRLASGSPYQVEIMVGLGSTMLTLDTIG